MKRFSILTIAFVAIFALSSPAFADWPHTRGHGPHPHGPPGAIPVFEQCLPGHDCHSGTDVDVNTTIGGDSFNYDFPVNTAAPVFAGNCAQGVSAQTMGFGGSIASGNSVCDFIAVAGAFIAGGERAEAFRVLGKAEKAADWRFLFSRIRMVITLGIL